MVRRWRATGVVSSHRWFASFRPSDAQHPPQSVMSGFSSRAIQTADSEHPRMRSGKDHQRIEWQTCLDASENRFLRCDFCGKELMKLLACLCTCDKCTAFREITFDQAAITAVAAVVSPHSMTRLTLLVPLTVFPFWVLGSTSRLEHKNSFFTFSTIHKQRCQTRNQHPCYPADRTTAEATAQSSALSLPADICCWDHGSTS